MTEQDRYLPDWVVLGAPAGDGKVVVYASKDLTHAEIQTTVDRDDVFMWPDSRWEFSQRRIELTVGLKTYTVVVADTYEQAFRTLFDAWTPGPAERPAIEAPQRAIEARPNNEVEKV